MRKIGGKMLDRNYTPQTHPITIKCQARDTAPIDALLEFQGSLKKLSKDNRDRLMGSILTKGFIAPIFVWDDAGDFRLLDGPRLARDN